MECNKDEATRAKEIAESKFSSKDLKSAKKFALKAQNLFPGLDGISQLLAVLDVHLAAENKVSGESDYYGILGVNPLADDDTVKKNYRKLALLLHPDKNKSIGADGAFQLVSQAWGLLSDKDKRLAYDHKRHAQFLKQRVNTQNVFTRVNIPKAGPTSVPEMSKVKPFSGKKNKVNGNKENGFQSKKPKAGPTSVPSSSNIEKQVAPETSKVKAFSEKKNKVNAGPTSAAPKTFWTVCLRCRLQYEFLRKYLNRKMLCPTCYGPFHATEIPTPNINPSSEKIEENNISAPETCKISFFERGPLKRDREEAGLDTNIAGPTKSASKKVKSVHQTKQDINININGFDAIKETKPIKIKNHLIKKATIEIKKKLDEWNSEAEAEKVADMANGYSKTDEADVPDPDFHDFDNERTENSFKEGQLWAAYDDRDGMPRNYAIIHKLISLNPFKMKVIWLSSKPNKNRFLEAFGEFQPGKHETVTSPNYFSHKATFSKLKTGNICVFPKKGSVCALYDQKSYEIVEVDEYRQETGVTVTPLVKVAGFKTVFHRVLDGEEKRVILEKDFVKISHEIPSYVITGRESENAPKGCLDLDPAAIPPEFLHVISDVKEDDKMDIENGLSADGVCSI